MAKISVVVPVYKVEPYLRRCIDSIIGQTFKDFELILIDDGSPDKCGEICDEYAKKDSRVVVIHQKNGGLSAARNAGIDWVFANSQSEFIGFIDSDDWVAYNYLEELHKGCQRCDIACVNLMQTSGENVSEHTGEVVCDYLPPDIYWQCRMLPMTAWGKLFKRELWKNVRFPVGKIHEDEYAIPEILFSRRQIASSDAKLYYYFRRGDSIVGRGYSVKRLDAIDAIIGQVKMFTDMGYEELARKGKIRLCQYYSNAILLLKRKDYTGALRVILKELQLTAAQYPSCYKAAYPLKGRFLIPVARLVDLFMRRSIRDIGHRLLTKFGVR